MSEKIELTEHVMRDLNFFRKSEGFDYCDRDIAFLAGANSAAQYFINKHKNNE